MTIPAPLHLARVARSLAIGCGVAVLFGTATLDVLAHANVGQSAPAADQTLAGGPDRVRLSFTETPDPAGTGLAVLDGGGAQVDLGDQVVSAADSQASVGLGPLGPGVYTVAWGSRSAVDGDDAKGFFAFAVGTPAAAPVLSIQGPGGANPGRATADDLAITLGALPGAGPHTFEADLATGGRPLADAQRVTLRLSSQNMDLGTSVVPAVSQGDGRYLATTWLPSLAGAWQAEVVVRRAGLDDSSATFTMQIGS